MEQAVFLGSAHAVPAKRLVILARQLTSGGAQRQLVVLAKGLQARGHDVQVVLFYGAGLYDDELAEAGVPVHTIGKRGRWDLVGFLWRLRRVLRQLQPDVVYSFLDVPNILSALLSGSIGRPVLVWSIRAAGMEMARYDWLSRLASSLETRLSRLADVVISNSNAGAAWAIGRGFPPNRFRVVENGIDTDRFRPDPQARLRWREEWRVPPQRKLIGVVGRLDVMKDHPNFFRAAALLRTRRDDFGLVCVGGGPDSYRDELVAFALEQGIDDLVLWAGVQRDMPMVYNALDIVCSSSAFGEGFSNAVGEAMACGTPCVVTDVGDSRRIVADLGEVVPPRDAAALAEALARMLGRLEHTPGLAACVREHVVSNYSVDSMVLRSAEILFSDVRRGVGQ